MKSVEWVSLTAAAFVFGTSGLMALSSDEFADHSIILTCNGDERESTVEAARAAMLQAVRFFSRDVSASGGYLWKYSADLQLREGETPASETTAWIQPPGTPSVGEAYLYAWQLTGEPALKDAAVETAYALVEGQLQSGGWDNLIEFDSADRKKYAYRTDTPAGHSKLRNTTTLDDDKTQSALRFLMHIDQELQFRNRTIHEAVTYAIARLLDAQYPNGAWPQRFSEPPDSSAFPVTQAAFPETWSRTWKQNSYGSHYTFNDNAIGDMVDTMLTAAAIYDDDRCLQAAMKADDFIRLAQLPEPQPAWAQQYNREMRPAWARKFEPPSVTGGESQAVMNTLLTLYANTGEERFLEPVSKAMAYFRRSLRDDGRLARFYEFGSNRPLYFTKDYQLTYSDADMPTHYAFVVSSKLDSIEKRRKELRDRDPQSLRLAPIERPRPAKKTPALARRASEAVSSLDDRGAWTETGTMKAAEGRTLEIIDCRTFIRNLRTLAEFVGSQHQD